MTLATRIETRPAYVVRTHAGCGPHGLLISVRRMDGVPLTDVYGEPLRQDSENWLSQAQAVALVSTLVAGIPRW